MTSMKVEDRIDRASNFHAWKTRVLIIIEENDLLNLVEGVPKPEEEARKSQ